MKAWHVVAAVSVFFLACVGIAVYIAWPYL